MQRRVFEGFRKLAYRQAGIAMKDTKEVLLSARIAKRVRALSLAGASEYLTYLESEAGDAEMVHFLDAISTNFTSFFREPDHFEKLREEAKRWARERVKPVRIWCAAAATGEEPYTLAMILSEALERTQVDFRVLATDISVRALEHASRGCYERARLGSVPLVFRNKYFVAQETTAGSPATFAVAQRLRERVVFKRLNLSTPPFPLRGELDAVFCRNVMIYFDAPVRQRLVSEMHRLLRPGGLFVVAHSETLSDARRGFETLGASMYRKETG